ncbi:hypothetical protein P879_01797 [Paragonimus westermani]|uniref:Nucleoporin NDC1 n=1 Tax=Paragonimus westermani TaxID=34504 RepID=A0A8T0DLR8_9TREM|nr:hypothetical protein P879_01797 [Paragonimus westermani]
MILQQELHSRLIFSCIVASTLSTLALFGVACIENIRFTYPWRWITNTLWEALSLGHLCAYCCNALIVSAIVILYYAKISVVDWVACKYIQLCTNLLWDNLQILMSSTALAGLNSLFVLDILAPNKYSSILSDTQFFTLNQRTHCLVSFGSFMGLIFCATAVIFNRLTLLYSQPATNLVEIIKDHSLTRALTTLGRIFYFIPLYALFPKPFCGLHYQSFHVFWLLLDTRMFFLLFIVGFHLQFSWGCAIGILKWQFSKPLVAPLNAIVDPTDSEQDVLTKPASPLKQVCSWLTRLMTLQHLVLQRLADLVAIDATARATVFSLNTLGGRPMFWRHISGWCTTALEQFLSSVQLANGCIIQKTVNTAVPSSEVMYQCHLPASFRTQLRRRNALNSAINPVVSEGSPAFVGSLLDLVAKGDYKGLAKTVSVKVTKTLSSLSVLQSLNSDLAYAATAQLFTGPTPGGSNGLPVYGSGQSIIWAVEILACLTLASYTEDNYGCVQRSLGRILVLFVDTLEAVEQHLRLVGLLTKEVGPTNASTETHHYEVSQDSSVSADADSSISLHPYTAHSTILRTEDVCNLMYYRFSSDPSLPWRIYATLTWTVSNCLRQFGDHLE